MFCSNIQDGHHGIQLEIIQTTSPPKPYVWLSWNLMGGITVTQRVRFAKIVPFWYRRWLPWWPSWNSSKDITSQTVSWIESKLDGRWEASLWHKDSEVLYSFCSNIKDGSHGGHLTAPKTCIWYRLILVQQLKSSLAHP